MSRQPSSEPCDVWLSAGACILAIDSAMGPSAGVAPPARAWLDGDRVMLSRGAELLALGPLAAEALAAISLGASAVVEFGPHGPEREVPIAPSRA